MGIRSERRNLILRTTRIWTKLYKLLTQELKSIVKEWREKFLRQAEKEIGSGVINEIPELPKKFVKTLSKRLREALAQGYWLNYIYVQDLKGKKHRGKITLSDLSDDEALRKALEDFINSKSSQSWHKIIPKDAVNFLDNYIPKLAGNFQQDVLEQTREVLRKSLLDGSTLQDRMKALRESSKALSKMTDQRIEAIARTEITRADTYGRLISMKKDEDVIGVEFSAILDDRTTDICESRDGLVMRLDDPRLPENTPPCHVNCRSMLLALTVYDYPDGLLTSKEFDEVPAGNHRPEDISELEQILNSESLNVEAAENTPKLGQKRTYEVMQGFKEQISELTEQYQKLTNSDQDEILKDVKKLLLMTLLEFLMPEEMNLINKILGDD